MRVFVDGYKSLRNVELELQPLTVIVGPNAAGKSNLFDALRLLSRIVTSRSLAEAFGDHRGDPLEAFDYSERGIAGLLEKEEARFTIEVDVELDGRTIKQAERLIQMHRATTGQGNHKGKPCKVTERFLRYRIEVAITPKTGVLRVLNERLESLTRTADRQVRPDEKRRPFLERIGERLRLRIEGRARPTEYDIGLNYSIVSQPIYPPYYPHLIAFREEVSQWRFYYFEPRLMREESPVKEAIQLPSSGGDLAAFYYTLKRKSPEQFENLQRALRLIVPTVERVDAELTEEGKVRLKVKERGVEFSAKVTSEGTLRILGLMAILSPSNPATVIGFEEPENGVHPRRLKLIADMLLHASKHRQIIVNTHSPLLPDYLSDEVYLVQCRKRDDGSSQFSPLEMARGVFRAQEVKEALEESQEERASQEVATIWQRVLRGDWG
ncbi:MAG: AAA family ATPase [Bacteroidota bacterium]|nr:AAA family ATPase [Rhodothermia bacterium]MDW8285723.1 AAA family ATPase [Bacteroidota bacterium]